MCWNSVKPAILHYEICQQNQMHINQGNVIRHRWWYIYVGVKMRVSEVNKWHLPHSMQMIKFQYGGSQWHCTIKCSLVSICLIKALSRFGQGCLIRSEAHKCMRTKSANLCCPLPHLFLCHFVPFSVLKDGHFNKRILPVKVTFSTDWSKNLFFWLVFIGRNVRLYLNLSSPSSSSAAANYKPLHSCYVFMGVDLSIFSLVNQHLSCCSEFIHTHNNFGIN